MSYTTAALDPLPSSATPLRSHRLDLLRPQASFESWLDVTHAAQYTLRVAERMYNIFTKILQSLSTEELVVLTRELSVLLHERLCEPPF